ncbi:hypothetical protein Pcinc_030183 [Petrolisthes cinctipes]|uniref:Uncharacterized protein n=1 Tax=Petrolisthes cinctipes TaxID=88211 RepID=A0AAE1K6N8_PETCI|nr:hypothetical protein Pcinc_030183 [Petrolisthes cinctipes]
MPNNETLNSSIEALESVPPTTDPNNSMDPTRSPDPPTSTNDLEKNQRQQLIETCQSLTSTPKPSSIEPLTSTALFSNTIVVVTTTPSSGTSLTTTLVPYMYTTLPPVLHGSRTKPLVLSFSSSTSLTHSISPIP